MYLMFLTASSYLIKQATKIFRRTRSGCIFSLSTRGANGTTRPASSSAATRRRGSNASVRAAPRRGATRAARRRRRRRSTWPTSRPSTRRSSAAAITRCGSACPVARNICPGNTIQILVTKGKSVGDHDHVSGRRPVGHDELDRVAARRVRAEPLAGARAGTSARPTSGRRWKCSTRRTDGSRRRRTRRRSSIGASRARRAISQATIQSTG